MFRTELSFRRNPRPLPAVRAEATHSGAGEGSSVDVTPAVDTTSELWPGEPHEIVSDAGTEAPLPKKERGIFRRRQRDASGDTGEPAEADVEPFHGAEVEVEEELHVELEPVAAEQPVEIEEPEVVIEDEIHDAPQAAADDEADAGDEPATDGRTRGRRSVGRRRGRACNRRRRGRRRRAGGSRRAVLRARRRARGDGGGRAGREERPLPALRYSEAEEARLGPQRPRRPQGRRSQDRCVAARSGRRAAGRRALGARAGRSRPARARDRRRRRRQGSRSRWRMR